MINRNLEKFVEDITSKIIEPNIDAKPNNDATKIMIQAGQILQKSAKEISEQSSFVNNMAHQLESSISKFKRAFTLKKFFLE